MIETEDLFLAGFGLVRGGELAGVVVRSVNGRRLAFFRIAGADLDQVEREYYAGQALVNLRLLKSEVARLKNVAFQTLREGENGRGRGERPRGG